MKYPLVAILALTLCSGCALFPKQIEFFQKKVKAVPELSDSAREHQRQAAFFIARQQLTNQVANALSSSLGPPSSPFIGPADKLANKLNHDQANFNKDLQDYRAAVQSEVGKKIEGTGLFQIGYFKFVGLIVGFFALIWFGIKVYGMFNPLVGTAAGVVGRVSSSILTKGFSEIVSGGQQFLQWVNQSNLNEDTKKWVTNTFKVAHQTQQSSDVQTVVDSLTTTPTNNTSPVSSPPIPPK